MTDSPTHITVKGKRLTIRNARIALRLYPHKDTGMTIAEAAEDQGVSTQTANSIIRVMGWLDNFKSVGRSHDATGFPDLSVIDATNAIATDMRRQLARAEE